MDAPDPTPPVAPQAVLPYADDATDPPAVVLGYVALKVLGLWLTIGAVLEGILGLLRFTGRGFARAMDNPAAALSFLAPGVVYGLAAAVLLVYARPLSRRLMRARGDVLPRLDARGVLALVSVCTGLVLIAQAAGPTTEAVVEIVRAVRQAGLLYFRRVSLESQTPTLVRLALGLVLFLRPSWVVALWERHAR